MDVDYQWPIRRVHTTARLPRCSDVSRDEFRPFHHTMHPVHCPLPQPSPSPPGGHVTLVLHAYTCRAGGEFETTIQVRDVQVCC